MAIQVVVHRRFGHGSRIALTLLGRFPCVIGFILTQHMHMRFCLEKKLTHNSLILDGRGSTRSTTGRPTRMALKLLRRLPCVIGIILTRHMHAIHAVDRRATTSDGLETSWEASLCHRDHFDSAYACEILPRKKDDPWVIDFGGTTTDGDLGRHPTKIWPRVSRIALKLLGRVPIYPLHCARFASAREKTCTSDRFDTWDLDKGEGRIEATRAESQWIVAARPLCHLQYPVAYLSRLQRIQPDARWEFVQGVPCGSSATRGSPTTRAFGGRGPYCWSANRRWAHASLLARILT
ncbi:Regulator of rDNA transcription protein 15 [Senna tora]|uniref:Regulator of rDNA transcription protein 15 n=1 Tax=Senna tora TaxID=362788 RepID=A0A834SBV0_9FABA|nr:Regulator of rDNA transcription protein 15 [Senna tora]